MANDLTLAQRERKLQFAEEAHRIKPNVPLSWLWLLEWASGQAFLFLTLPAEGQAGEVPELAPPGYHEKLREVVRALPQLPPQDISADPPHPCAGEVMGVEHG